MFRFINNPFLNKMVVPRGQGSYLEGDTIVEGDIDQYQNIPVTAPQYQQRLVGGSFTESPTQGQYDNPYLAPYTTRVAEAGIQPPGAPLAVIDEKPVLVPPVSLYGENMPLPEEIKVPPVVPINNQEPFTDYGLPYPEVYTDPKNMKYPADAPVLEMPGFRIASTMRKFTPNTNNNSGDIIVDPVSGQPMLNMDKNLQGNQEINVPPSNLLTQGIPPAEQTVPLNQQTTPYDMQNLMPEVLREKMMAPGTGVLNPYTGTINPMPVKGPGQITVPEMNLPIAELPPEQRTETPEALTEQEKTQANSLGMTPEQYYMLKGTMDLGALFNNMIQQPPPSLQMAIPHMEKIRMDRTPFEQQRTDIEKMGRQSYRGLREGVSQVSDLLKGIQAVTSGTQEAMRQVGTAEAQAALQVEQTNQQISNQEQAMQTDILNQEQQANLVAGYQAQMHKDQMVSNQLARIGDTAGAYAQYLYGKEEAKRHEEANKLEVEQANELQVNWLKYEAAKSELGSPEFNSSEQAAIKQQGKDIAKNLLGDPKYGALKNKYGDAEPSYTDYVSRYEQEANTYEPIISSISQFEKLYSNGAPVETDFDSPEAYKNALSRYEQHKTLYDTHKDDPNLTAYQQEGQFWKDVYNKWDKEGMKAKHAEQYLSERGLPTTAQFVSSLEAIMNRTLQK
jgi:hypothetical protein